MSNAKISKRAARAYAALSAEGSKIKTLFESELRRIAHAINPDFDRDTGRGNFMIMDSVTWDGLSPSLDVHSTHHSDFGARATLVFHRARVDYWKGEHTQHDIRLVFEFQRSKSDERRVWIDCETGRPWRPTAVLKHREYLTDERRKECEAFDAKADFAALRELGEIGSEKRRARQATHFAGSGPVEGRPSNEASLDSAAGVSLQPAEAA